MNPLSQPVTTEQETIEAVSSCNICGSLDFKLVSDVDRRKNPLKTVICTGCGLVFTQNSKIADLKQFYTKVYRGSGRKPLLKHILRHGNNALKRYLRLKHHLKPDGAVLDVGSGNGEFVYLLSFLGFKAKGVEPHESSACYSQTSLGIDIEICFLEELAASHQEQFDMVTIFHVLEHKDDPSETLSIINRLLKPGGICVVEVPNISSYSMTPKNLFHIDHLYNFNAATLALLGQKAGFTVLENRFSRIEGNITVIFQKSALPESVAVNAPENYTKLSRKLKNHTDFIHYCTPMPYIRFLRKFARYFYERHYTSKFTDGKVMLNALYQKHRHT